MTTAAEIVEDGLAIILVDEENIALEASELAIGVRFLNDKAAQMAADGVDFGYRPVSAPDDIITSPADVNLPLKYIVARMLGPVFGIPVSPDVHAEARSAERTLVNRYYEIESSNFPSTLPKGSGNYNRQDFFDEFYNDNPAPVGHLRLDAAVTPSISTINTPVQVGGWEILVQANVTATTGGTFTYLPRGAYLARLTANLTVDSQSGDQFTFYFTLNDAILAQSRLPFDADTDQNILVDWVGTVSEKDEIKLMVENNSDTNDLTITHGHFRIL